MSLFNVHPILQCDGGGGDDDESSSDGEETSDTSVDSSNDEEESEESSEEIEQEDQEEEEVKRKNTKSNPSPSSSTATTQRGRVTRQYARDQLPTKRLLRSRKKSPAAGSGSKQTQTFPCPNCKREFNNKTSMSRHGGWCKPKNKTTKKKLETKDEKVAKTSGIKTPNSTKRSASTSKDSSKDTPDGNPKRKRGRPKKSDTQSPTAPQIPVRASSSFQHEQIPEDDFMLQRSPDSSPGLVDTSSESDYEQREYVANVHHLNSNRSRGISIDVENPDHDEDVDDEEQTYHHEQPQPMYMDVGQEEMVLQANGPVTCQKCGMTYRTRQGYENHFPSCTAYSSSDEEQEDEEVDVVDDDVSTQGGEVVTGNWNQSATPIVQNSHNKQSVKPAEMDLNSGLPGQEEAESSEERASSSDNESQEKPSTEQVQVPLITEDHIAENRDCEMQSDNQLQEKNVPIANVVVDVTQENLTLNHSNNAVPVSSSEKNTIPAPVLETPAMVPQPAPKESYNIPNPIPIQIAQSQSHNSVASTPSCPPSQQTPSNFPSATTVISSQVQQFMPAPVQQQDQQNHPTPPPQPPQYNFNPMSSAQHSTPLLHHAQASSNTPTYTQAQLMPGTVLHNSVMQVQQQMSTTAGPLSTSECYQPSSGPQPPIAPQLLQSNNMPQPVLRVQNNAQGLNGPFQVPHQQLQAIPQSAGQQQQQASAFVNVPQQQIFRTGGGPVILDQRMQQAIMPHPTGQQQHSAQQIPQQVPMSGGGHPSGHFQHGLPEQFQYLNANTMPAYSLNMSQQQIQQLQFQQAQHQQIGAQLQNFPSLSQQQQAPHVQQSMSMHVPNQNHNTMGNQQQMVAQPEPPPAPNSALNGNGTQFPTQQNPIQFQYYQQSQPKLMVDPNHGMAQVQQMVQNDFNGQTQNLGAGPIPPRVHYQIQQQTQPMFQPQQQQQQEPPQQQLPPPSNPNGNVVPGQHLNPQMFQANFQNSMIQGPTPSDLQQQQNHNLQQHQLYQMQLQQQANQPQLQLAPNDAQKSSQPQLNGGQLFMNASGGLQWAKPGMQLIQGQQQFQRPSTPQQSSQPQAGVSPQQHQIQAGQPQQPNSASQQINQVIQQIAQITDGSGNTCYVIIAPTPAQSQQQNGGLSSGNNNISNVLNLIPGLQNIQPSQQQLQTQPQQHQQQQNTQLAHCALQAGVNGVVNQAQAASHSSGATPQGSAGRSGPCPCPSCKEKLGTANAMEKFKKVLPYPSANGPQHSPTDQLKPIQPNVGATTRHILIRPAGCKAQKPIRAQKSSPDAQQQNIMTPPPAPQLLPPPVQTSPMRVLPLAMKMVMPSTTLSSSATIQQGVPTSSPNIAVVRPMENPLQKLTDQISQIETSFMAPPTYQHQQQPFIVQNQGSPQPQQIFQQQAASPIMAPQRPPQGPHLTLVTASPPPSAALQAPLISTVSPNQLQQLIALPNGGSPVPPGVVQNLQPRLMLVGSPVPTSLSPNTTSAPCTPSTTPVKTGTMTTAGVKRKIDPPTTTDSSNKSIKLTLKRKEGGDSYSINSISGSTSASGTMKSLKIKGQIKSGEQAGTSSDVLVVPCIHTVPVPDPDADGGNQTIAEDAQGSDGATGSFNGESNEGKASKGRLLHRAVIVYEVQSNETVLFRSSDVRAVWGYILETVQGQRLNHNLPPLPYPTTDISLPHNDPEAESAFNKLGLTHRAVQFLLEELKTLLVRKQMPNASPPSSSPNPKAIPQSQPTAPTSSSSCSQLLSLENGKSIKEAEDDDVDEPIPENASGCARTERFIGRKPFDMFGWLASKHRNPVPSNSSMDLTRRLTAPPLGKRSRKPKERQDGKLVLGRSKIHGRGLFTTRDIEKGEMIIEYAGEVIRPIICDIREKYYESKSMGCYMFRIKDQMIDATMNGNSARFINHACEPNCESKIKELGGKARILIYALRRISRGEELTYDYKFDPEEEKIPCACGSKHCRKYLN